MRKVPPGDRVAALVITLVLIGAAFFIAVNLGAGIGIAHLTAGLVIAAVLGIVGLLRGKR